MFSSRKNKTKGFSMIETLVAVSIFAIVSVALFSSYKQVIRLVSKAQSRSEIAALSVEQFEIIKNLPYDKIGTISGIPNGVIPQTKTIVKGDTRYTVNTIIRNIDLPYDGLIPSDISPADNKLAQVEIICENCREKISSTYTAQFGPKDLEGSSSNGSIFVRTIDASGNPVEGATVTIKVDPPDAVINLTDNTNLNGILQLVGAPPAKNAYRVYVSKPGYTSDETYSSNGPTTTKPVIPYATVDTGTVTQLTFVIDKVSTLNVKSLTPLCTPIPDVDFTLTGSKIIGYEPIFKFNNSYTTNALGEYIVSNVEWDNYKASASKIGFDLIGMIPSPQFSVSPNTTQAMQFVMIPNGESGGGQNKNTMTVSVKDGISGAQMSGVNVLFEHSLETINAITGRGQMIQTDWSNGGGQVMYDDIKAYATDDGNISVNNSPGSVELKKVSNDYATEGTLTSSIIDTGLASNFYEFRFSPLTQPAGTDIKFQLATSNATSGPFVFLGPDATAATFYTKDSSIINVVNNGKRYIKYKMYLSTADVSKTPVVEDVVFYFTSSCMAPGQAYAQTIHNGAWDITISKAGYQTITDHVSIGGTVPWLSKSYTLDPE